MTYNFCTLFDKNYLLKGLALHQSLLKHIENFKLWILCMDEETHDILRKLNLKNIEVIKLTDFEDPELLKIKSGRKKSEYCWTCTSSLPLYIFKNNPELKDIAYLDADLFFTNSPKKIYEEFGECSIMIIPHNFSNDQKWREKTSGKFNVGMLIFRNDKTSLECLRWWRERCLEWCFDYYEDGKLGDQLYLNDWPTRFEKVHVLQNRGANVASWNVRRYIFLEKDSQIFLKEKDSDKEWTLIFYHFHGVILYKIFGKIIAKPFDIENENVLFKQYSLIITEKFKLIKNHAIDFKFSNILQYIFRTIKSFLPQLK